ncbi:MAG: ribonuclease J [Clostridia bacterium]|nr:ribonuclease J [Clostridia bacterium]
MSKRKTENRSRVKVAFLGGIGEIGKNLCVIESENDLIIVDCGLGFPDEEMFGIDLVIPDFTYLEDNSEKIRGIFITHGHEDHIGAIPFLLMLMDIPIYATALSAGILENKLEEHVLDFVPRINRVKAGDKIEAGDFSVEFINVNHSIPDSCALAISSPAGMIVHSGDFKIDTTPIESKTMNIARLSEIGKKGVTLMLCESTNADRPGYTPSERTVGDSLSNIFIKSTSKRIVIATFSSNVHRIQQIINLSAQYKRKVAITGRSMLNIIDAAIKLGYMKIPEGTLIEINDIKRFKPEQITVVTTGSQGEPMSALYKMCFSEKANIELSSTDVVVISASAIPGNEKLISKIVNELARRNIAVIRDSSMGVHVSGHACQEELKLMHTIIRPKFFMPIHGEYRQLYAHREIAKTLGMKESNIFVGENGKTLEISKTDAKWGESIESGNVMIDGYGIGDVGSTVLRDRKHLGEDGIIIVACSVSAKYRDVISGPEILSRGFVYVRESEELMDELKSAATATIRNFLKKDHYDCNHLKTKIRDDLSKYIYSKTKRNPVILPVILEE